MPGDAAVVGSSKAEKYRPAAGELVVLGTSVGSADGASVLGSPLGLLESLGELALAGALETPGVPESLGVPLPEAVSLADAAEDEVSIAPRPSLRYVMPRVQLSATTAPRAVAANPSARIRIPRG